MLIENIARLDGARRIAKKILSAFAYPFIINGHELSISASIGIALHPQDGHDPDALLKSANSAMYHTKRHGKHDFRFYSE